MAQKQSLVKLGKFLSYILGHRPDEFGLVPDSDGYVKIKDLLKALNEETGWRHIRKTAIDELLISLPQPPVETKENMIRAIQREYSVPQLKNQNLPKLLFTCIRKRAYPHVIQKGISPIGNAHVVLSMDRSFAERMGKRIDQNPILLTIQVKNALHQNIDFYQFGSLFLSDSIPMGCFTGPPLPKEKVEPKPKEINSEKQETYHPGSFTIDFNKDRISPKSFDRKKKKKDSDWKRERKKLRRQKQKP